MNGARLPLLNIELMCNISDLGCHLYNWNVMIKEIRNLLECLIQEVGYTSSEAKLKAYTVAVDLLLKNQQLFEYEPEHMVARRLDLNTEENITFFRKKSLLLIDKITAAAGAGQRCIYRTKGVRVFLFEDGHVLVVTPHSIIDDDGLELHNEEWLGEELPSTIEEVERVVDQLNEPDDDKLRVVSEEMINILCNINVKYKKSYCLEYVLTPPDVNVISSFSKSVRELLWEVVFSSDSLWPETDVNLCMDFLLKNEINPLPHQLIGYITTISKVTDDKAYFENRLTKLEKILCKKIDESVNFENLPDYFNSLHIKPIYQEELDTTEKVKKVVGDILSQFKDLVENKGGWKQFWNKDWTPRNEKSAQEIFYMVADSFCKANNIDLSPEANFGNGPVDFKFSNGYDTKVVVEMKLSTNPKIVHGYEKQLEVYKAAENTSNGIFLIIDVGQIGGKYEKVLQLKQKFPLSEVWYVNAEYRESASKRIQLSK